MESIDSLYKKSQKKLMDAGVESYAIDAILIICHALDISKEDFFRYNFIKLDEKNLVLIDKLIARRVKHEPLAYIVQSKEFYGLNFSILNHCLIPRPESELIVDHALKFLKNFSRPQASIIDLGTGSGAIGLAILYYGRLNNIDLKLFALDIDHRNTQIAFKNAQNLGISDYCTFLNQDFCDENFTNSFVQNFGTVDLLVSNPPYITTNDMKNLSKEVQHEPLIALHGDFDGLFFYRNIANFIKKLCSNDAKILLEIGKGMKYDVMNIFAKENVYYNACYKDLSNIERVLEFDI